MGCGASVVIDEAPMTAVVFGANGMVGGAVAKILVNHPRFTVKAITRKPTSDVVRKLAEDGAVIGTADLDDKSSLECAVRSADVMFLVTHYWEHMDQRKEIQQGKNAVDVAVKCKIKHLVFCGAESVLPVTGKECGHMDAKASIEEYIKEAGITYTVLRLPFFYENLLSVFKPHNIGPELYTIALPIEGVAIDCMSVLDMSKCVMNLFLRPRDFLNRTVGLTAERMTSQHMAETMQKCFTNKRIIASDIRVQDYENFQFKGSRDIAAMFEFYQMGELERDVKITKKLCGTLLPFERWVAENKDKFDAILSNQHFS